jgi:HSP20 family protein
MPLPSTPANTWFQNLDLPSQLFESTSNDYELYEEDDEFVLSVEMPGFDPEEIRVTWDNGVLNIAGEHEDETRNRRRTYHRRFRFPKRVDEGRIDAEYDNGILDVRLPVEAGATARGTEIEVKT